MNESLKNETSIREYLLGRVSDETLLADYEELLFLDEDFCSLTEIAEDDLINDFVFNRLNEKDLEDFQKTLIYNKERAKKTELAKILKEKAAILQVENAETKPSFFESLKVFFQKPLNVGAFAVVLIGILIVSFFIFKKPNADEIAELKTVYSKERPIEARISSFDYAPLAVTRGAAEEREKSKLRRIENELLETVEKNPSAENLHKLGVFYLTQGKSDEAVKELEKAVIIDGNNAKLRNDLGSAYLEIAEKQPNEKKLETLAKALENFEKAYNLEPNLLAALFNKSLCLQKLRLYNQAKESWNLYLEKDKNSGWAEEARKNLERLEILKSTSKTKEQVLEDFLAAYRNQDQETAWKINSQTREMISGVWLPDQLSKRFLEAKIRGDDNEAKESIEALKLIGNLEKEKNADFFVAEIADFYEKTNNFEEILTAKQILSEGFAQIVKKQPGQAKTSFETSAKMFEISGNLLEKHIAELWIAHSLTDLSKIKESSEILEKLSADCRRKNYLWLNLAVSEWAANNLLLQDEITLSNEKAIENLQTAESLQEISLQTKFSNILAAHYQEVGELKKASKYLGKSLFAPNDYRKSESIKWQNFYYSAAVFNKLEIFSAAENFGKEAIFIAENSSLKNSQAFDDSLKLLLEIYKKKKDFPKALKFAEESLLSAENTKDTEFQNRLLQYATLEIADLKLETGNFKEALQNYEKTIELLKKNPETEIDNYSAEKGKLLCLLALGRKAEIAEQLKKTLELSEKYRLKILDEETRNVFFENQQSVYEIAVETALSDGNPQKAFEYAEASKARNLLDFIQGDFSVSELEKKYPSLAKPLLLKDLQEKLPPNVQVAEYFQLKEKLVIWLISQNEFKVVEQKVSDQVIEAKTNEFLNQIINEKDFSPEIQKDSEEFFEILIEPISSFLDRKKTLVIVADRDLYKLPFAAFSDKKTNRFLVEDFPILFSPSANVLIKATETAKQREKYKDESLLAVGNPQFDREENQNLKDLPSAEFEARKIVEFYPQNRLFIGADATKKAVTENLREKNIFHFAGHYVTNLESTPNSKILLAKSNESGNLPLSEIADFRLERSKFVVLSACETNGEKIFQGEGATGIAQSFLAVGAPVVVASNWKVDSEAAKDLMIAFHRNRRIGKMNISEALRQAQIEMLKNTEGNFRSPYYWSAFSAVGAFTNY
ncbi:MAG TPA: CHAT domain-containing protein [Pyrinomonadaceae bacterium]|nr:CHAT domain-containing protein [Pyrinomonadaceae bacterium]